MEWPKNSERTNESIEGFKERIGRITVYRHGDTHYTQQYPDLTDEGQRKLTEAGRALKDEVDEEQEDLIFLHSPTVRAKASMAYLLHGMEKIAGPEEKDVEELARPVRGLSSAKTLNPEGVQETLRKYMDLDALTPEALEAFDRVYAVHDEFETSPHWEPRSRVERRSGKLLRQALLKLVKNHPEEGSEKTPHIVAVSHFETLNHLAAKIFDLDLQKDPLYARGEKMSFEVLTNRQDPKRLLLNCTFRGAQRAVWYDVEKGEIAIS